MNKKKTITASIFVLSIGAAFASRGSGSKRITSASRFYQVSNNRLLTTCSNVDKFIRCGTAAGGDIFQVDNGTVCSFVETVYIYKPD